jgi:hypothetical protein
VKSVRLIELALAVHHDGRALQREHPADHDLLQRSLNELHDPFSAIDDLDDDGNVLNDGPG